MSTPDPAGRRSFFSQLFSSPEDPGSPAPAEGPEPEGEVVISPDAGDTICWTLEDIPANEATQHFLICGTVGSGKTIAIRLLLQSIAHRFKPGWRQPEQLVLFDAKVDALPLLDALGFPPDDPAVWLLNPQDQRSAVWNVAEAVTDPLMARQLATLLVPEEPGSTAPYFSDAAREIVYAVILALNTIAHTNWTLRDLLCALDSREHITAVTRRMPRAQILAERVLKDDRHSSGVLSTLGTKLGRFEQVAALWYHQRDARRFTIADFLAKPGVLVLGNDPLLRDSLWPINAILLRALTQHILRAPNVDGPRHWFILDEFRAMERVDCIHDLVNRGRSKGASVLLGIQSIAGLLSVYGRDSTNDLLSACSYKTFLRLGDPDTAHWAERYFGQVRRTEEERSESSSASGPQESTAYRVHDRPLFLASYFMSLPFPRPDGPYQAVADLPCQDRTLLLHRPFRQVLARCIPPSSIDALRPFTNPTRQILEPWSKEEEHEFCHLPAAPSDSSILAPEPDPKTPSPSPTTDGGDGDDQSDQSGLPPRGALGW